MISRLIKPLKSNSFFIFGARGTGKTTFLEAHLPRSTLRIDLLDDETFDRYLSQPKLIEELSKSKKYEWIAIDEIQRLPKLLNSVHRMIEKEKQKFALTGSSSRKLKRGGANLLAGRAFIHTLFPFTTVELGDRVSLQDLLHWGSLPKTVELSTVEEKRAYLRSYCLTYIKEEIIAEQIVRKLEPFREFLTVAAQSSGKIINYSSIARDVGAQVPTVQTYFQILEETYIGFILPHFHRSIRKSQLSAPKFYFFDNGVKKALEASLDSAPVEGTYQFGDLFEAFIIQEIHRLNQYYEKDFRLSYFRTKNDAEIDLILTARGKDILIEIKSATRVDEIVVNKLARLREGFKSGTQAYFLSRDTQDRQIAGVECMEWKKFLAVFKGL